MTFVENIRDRATYIGSFQIHGSTMTFHRDLDLRRKDIIAMGDMVYFMFVNGQLMKIGKAGGATGFAGRAGMYNRGRLGDATNNRILDIMEEIGKTTIDVFAIPVPRQVVKYECPVTGEIFEMEVSIHKDIETLYTDKYLMEDASNELPFCNQLA